MEYITSNNLYEVKDQVKEEVEAGREGNIGVSFTSQKSHKRKDTRECRGCHEVGHILRDCAHVICFDCGEKGHIARYCPNKKRKTQREQDDAKSTTDKIDNMKLGFMIHKSMFTSQKIVKCDSVADLGFIIDSGASFDVCGNTTLFLELRTLEENERWNLDTANGMVMVSLIATVRFTNDLGQETTLENCVY